MFAAVGLTDALIVLGIIAALAVVAGVVWWNWRQGRERGRADSLKEWMDVAAAREARIVVLTAEKAELERKLEKALAAHEECEKLKEDFGKFNLRLQAREESYQKCINRLEVALNMPPTQFDDPTVHITQGGFR